MNIKEKLEILYRYYMSTRGVGHSYTMLNGFNNNSNAKVIVRNSVHGKVLGIDHRKTVSLNELEKLYGMNNPIIFDNFAMMGLIGDALMEIRSLEAEIEILKQGKDS